MWKKSTPRRSSDLSRALDKKQKPKKKRLDKGEGDELIDSAEDTEWREKLHHILTKKLDPAAFERLTQRLL